ncbi:MAG TPA: hypothetical protein VFV38_07015 [Ktedonobacteraceae bacterium]|nr:hypothetical protein [Ktedonobacteraceae bacterium]
MGRPSLLQARVSQRDSYPLVKCCFFYEKVTGQQEGIEVAKRPISNVDSVAEFQIFTDYQAIGHACHLRVAHLAEIAGRRTRTIEPTLASQCAKHLLYGMFSHQYTLAELRQMPMSDPFDRSATPRQLTVVELAEWLEALLV